MSVLRRNLAEVAKQRKGSHAGLILSRYLAGHDEKDRESLLTHARSASQTAQTLYTLAYDRWCVGTATLPSGTFRVRSRLITGLGSKGVLETGIRLHHTYGTPLIPGSGLKGLAAHYCRESYGPDTPESPLHETCFGSTGLGGHITFHDAWILPESISPNSKDGLVFDVMTPHHPNYYSGANVAPSDAEDPIPVSFLSVRGRFRVVVECDVPGENGLRWGQFALRLLSEALDSKGVGGKTSSGYGRMTLERAAG